MDDVLTSIREGRMPIWPTMAEDLQFAQFLDRSQTTVNHRKKFNVPTKAELKQKSLMDDSQYAMFDAPDKDRPEAEECIYFCGNSLGLQPKAVRFYMNSYLKTWAQIGVNGHFKQLENSPIHPYQDMAARCSELMADIVGAAPSEVVAMNTLTINLHLMMAAFYKPVGKKCKIMCEWRPFPSDWYAIESQIEWHGLVPKEAMLLVEPDDDYLMTTGHITALIDKHADELALILLPGIQYWSGQLLDIPTITAHAHKRGVTIGWDLAHAAGNVELKLHDWDVDFACWCTYKYMNAGAGAIAGCFVHSKHGDNGQTVNGQNVNGLKGWYGHDRSSRFLMDNKFVPTAGAQGFQCSNPSIVDLTCLAAALNVFEKTNMKDLTTKSRLLTSYAEHLLDQIASRYVSKDAGPEPPFRVITPKDPRFRGAQLSVLLREELMDAVSASLEANGVVCDKRKPGIIRVAPVPLYNTFADVCRFMEIFEGALPGKKEE